MFDNLKIKETHKRIDLDKNGGDSKGKKNVKVYFTALDMINDN